VKSCRSIAPWVAVGAALFAAWPSVAPAAPVPTSWCGTSTATAQTDRKPDAVAAHQVGVVYAYPAGGADNFGTVASQIVTDLATVDAWWLRQDPTRGIRYDLHAFPGCATRLGQLDLAKVALPRDATAYRALITGWERLADDLSGPPFGFSNRYKKYLVYYDGPRDDEAVCGIAGGDPFRGPSYAQVYLQSCWRDVGTGGVMAVTAVHELLHALGAVPAGAPNVCLDSPGHACDSVDDLMYPSTSGQALDAIVLDEGNDDYYNHTGSWFDVQDSFWLAHLDALQSPLTVTVSGTGTVASELPGIECPGTCTIGWDRGTRVRLVPSAAPGARFTGWKGACSGLADCAVLVDAAKDVTATFATGARGGGPGQPPSPQAATSFRLSVNVRGGGRIVSTPSGISCARTCTARFDEGSSVSLRAVAAEGWRFNGWTAACRGKGATCRFSMQADQGIRATFLRRR
jgi:List-Bact-rpt repeat protein